LLFKFILQPLNLLLRVHELQSELGDFIFNPGGLGLQVPFVLCFITDGHFFDFNLFLKRLDLINIEDEVEGFLLPILDLSLELLLDLPIVFLDPDIVNFHVLFVPSGLVQL
jgi:hypothetical protein